jgi:hypothetical protein
MTSMAPISTILTTSDPAGRNGGQILMREMNQDAVKRVVGKARCIGERDSTGYLQ